MRLLFYILVLSCVCQGGEGFRHAHHFPSSVHRPVSSSLFLPFLHSFPSSPTHLRLSRYSYQMEKLRRLAEEGQTTVAVAAEKDEEELELERMDLESERAYEQQLAKLREDKLIERQVIAGANISISKHERKRVFSRAIQRHPQLATPYNYTDMRGNVYDVPFVEEPKWYMVFVTKQYEKAVAERLHIFNATAGDPLEGIVLDTFFLQGPRFYFEKKRGKDRFKANFSPIMVSVAPKVLKSGVLFVKCSRMSPAICADLENVLGLNRVLRHRETKAVGPLTPDSEASLIETMSKQAENLVVPEHLKNVELYQYVNITGGGWAGMYGVVNGIKDNFFEVLIRDNGRTVQTDFIDALHITHLPHPPEEHYRIARSKLEYGGDLNLALRDDQIPIPRTEVIADALAKTPDISDKEKARMIRKSRRDEIAENRKILRNHPGRVKELLQEDTDEEEQEPVLETTLEDNEDMELSFLSPEAKEFHPEPIRLFGSTISDIRAFEMAQQKKLSMADKRIILDNLLSWFDQSRATAAERKRQQELLLPVEEVPFSSMQRPRHLYPGKPLPKLKPRRKHGWEEELEEKAKLEEKAAKKVEEKKKIAAKKKKKGPENQEITKDDVLKSSFGGYIDMDDLFSDEFYEDFEEIARQRQQVLLDAEKASREDDSDEDEIFSPSVRSESPPPKKFEDKPKVVVQSKVAKKSKDIFKSGMDGELLEYTPEDLMRDINAFKEKETTIENTPLPALHFAEEHEAESPETEQSVHSDQPPDPDIFNSFQDFMDAMEEFENRQSKKN